MKKQIIELISIPVADQERAKNFYCDVLGFHVTNDNQFEPDKRWLQLTPSPEAETSITLVTWFEDMPPGNVKGLILITEDISAMHKKLQENGVAISPVEETPWGKFAHFKDPDGNGWSLHE